MFTNKIKLFIFLISVCLVANVYLFWAPNYFFSESSNESTLYDEIIQQIEKKGIFFQLPINQSSLNQKGIKQFLQDHDVYSNFLSPEENQIYQESLKSFYVGVGMEITKNKYGSIACFPDENGPAYNAGIQPGNLLMKVNGVDVSNISIFKVASMIKGKAGESVELFIQQADNQTKKFNIIRSQTQSKSVFLRWYDNQPIIEIHSFILSTQREIKSVLRSIPASDPLIIDLRNNPGGDLFSAIDSAMLFLPSDSTIVFINTKANQKKYISTTPSINNSSQIYLLQNQNTASAAEVFIAALVQNKRAKSIGSITYGKGTQQSLISLSDHSLIIITTAYLLPPNQKMFHEKGLLPTYELSDFMINIQQLISHISYLDTL